MVTMALMTSATLFAAQIDDSNLTAAQTAELKAHAAKMSAQNLVEKSSNSLDSLSPEKAMSLAATWGTQASVAAKGFAEALGVAARELNISVNDFLGTPAGKMTAVLIIWKVAGSAILHMLFGLSFAITGMIVARVIYLRLFTKEMMPVESNWFWGMFKTTKNIRTMKSFRELDDGGEWLAFWIMIAVLLGSMAIGGVIMMPV